MPYLSSPVDGAQLFYRVYRPTPSTGTSVPNIALPALVFLRGWPSSSLMFESLMLPLCEYHHFRCIEIDRRGFGNSDQRALGLPKTSTKTCSLETSLSSSIPQPR